MDDLSAGIYHDELMDLEEGSDLDEEEDELIDEPVPSSFQFPSPGPASAATSTASSPPSNDDFSLPYSFSGKPLNIKRGRGRPRREGGKPSQRRPSLTHKIRKLKSVSYPRGGGMRRLKIDNFNFDYPNQTPGSGDEMPLLDPETGAFIYNEREKPATPMLEELPYFPEQWPGKVCAFCNLGERSQLGQGELMKLICPEGFIPQRLTQEGEIQINSSQISERFEGDKSPRGPVTCRRQKSFNKCRNPSLTSEYIDELTIIGYTEEAHVSTIFDTTGYFYTHRNCTLWSEGVIRNENSALENVGFVVLQSSSRKCSFCGHYGASIVCKVEECVKVFHFPCATASGAFQMLHSFTLFCNVHIGDASQHCENIICYTCKTLGDVANLMYCSSCGEHYHGICVGLAQLPGVRAGWQCRKCRVCQVCRISGDESKLMTCEQCDKIYHSTCQRPVVASIPKYGWKCRCCRVCGDCGSRTPGAGLSSRWHAHYTVCDSCYQQRNKGFSCPLCHRAYRAHAHREMVQCTLCRKFVHGTCDPEADSVTYHQRKESHPEYEYVCLMCKNLNQQGVLVNKRNSTDEFGDCFPFVQDSLYDESSDLDGHYSTDGMRIIGLGKGKPYSASKVAKKRLGLTANRPKGKGIPVKSGFMKRQRLTEFGRKRGAKSKMRGVFGVPGVGLQRPVADGKNDEEPGVENRLILCSGKDKFVLTQDICVMCGALGTDQEGCLIGCVQCGQCYHPYCVNVKVTTVILQKGWRCLDCTVCEGCGQRNDESRLILCDDCDISYHIYCMDPPLEYVPHGNWKCKWCAICQSCGAKDPGFNCTWMNSYSECGPCASHITCPGCQEPYSEGDLIIQCVQCERWLHGTCDNIKTEEDAEKCAEEGYNCLLCRPRDVPPPHLILLPNAVHPPTPTKSPEGVKSNNNYLVDGIHLSESGYHLIKSLSVEQHGTRKKRKKIVTVQDKEAGIMATIESVVAGGSTDNILEDSAKLELVDVKDEPQELYKEGMIWVKEDGPPPDGFTIFTMDNGSSVLRRKRQRNLQKLGIGGFLVRMRRNGPENEDTDNVPAQASTTNDLGLDVEKPRRKPTRRKLKSKLAEAYPPYLQEAFFGKDLLDATKEVDSSSSDEEKQRTDLDKTIQLTQDEIKAVAQVTAKHETGASSLLGRKQHIPDKKLALVPKVEDDSTEDLKDVLTLPRDLLDADIVNTIMNEGDAELSKDPESLDAFSGSSIPDEAATSKESKDDLRDILGSNFSLEAMPNINSKDVEDIFKGVLTDDSQESQESNVFPLQNPSTQFTTNTPQAFVQHSPVNPPLRPTTLPAVNTSNLNSPLNFPPPSPYQSEYSNSPQFSPAFSEPPSPWVAASENNEMETPSTGNPSTYNQRSSEKMKADEGLAGGATISAVLYANLNHSDWKTEFPNWSERYKQILKKWRTLSSEQKAPYLQQARDNRSALRMKKQQQSQISKDVSTVAVVPPPKVPTAVAVPVVSSLPQTQVAPVSEVCTQRPTPTPSLTTASSTSSVSVSPPPSPLITPCSTTPSTQQQFTVHGQLFGPGDHCGPAPNVTVNPLYQPNLNTEQPILRAIQSTPPATDQQIRVLTPSEIMRTLPSLCQENYEPQVPDQEKVALQHKSAREAEQERQWKQLQALRQQQAQQQQNVLHEQRVQAIARAQRQISDPNGTPMSQDHSPQELSPVTSPASRQLLNVGIKSPTFSHSVPSPMRPTPAHTPIEFPETDPFVKQAQNAKLSQPSFPQQPLQRLPTLTDQYPVQSLTPRPQFTINRPQLPAVRGEAPELNRQLRELLQKQQFKKLDDQILAGKGQQRLWPPNDGDSQEIEVPSPSNQTPQASTTGDPTFRQPLPPSMSRPRLPVPVVGVPRQPHLGLRMIDPRMQGLDPRMRVFLQQQRLMQQTGNQSATQQIFSNGTVRFAPGIIRTTTPEQYDLLIQKQQAQPQFIQRRPDQQLTPRLALGQLPNIPRATHTQPHSTTNDAASTDQEIPDNVTAELEKLEQETGTMAELQGVSDILGGLGEDDDELLAEMGADFNILEYADPEALPGEKTNILDLELEEEPIKNDKKVKVEIPKAPTGKPILQIKKETVSSQQALPQPNVQQQQPPPPLSISQSAHPVNQNPPLTPQQIYQQMLHQVQQAAALGKPMPPGSKLQTSDGIIGIVTNNNNIQLQVPQSYHQRLLVSQLQNQKLQMRLGGNVPRMMAVSQVQPGLHLNPRLGAPQQNAQAPPPPPPPYPGPPPPYPGTGGMQQAQSQSQMGLRMGPIQHPLGHLHPMRLQGLSLLPHLQRRPLLLEEQPLLLEDLLEQERREQEKQNQNTQEVPQVSASGESEQSPLLSDHEFERLKADVFSGNPMNVPSAARPQQPAMNMNQPQTNWQPNQTVSKPAPTAQSAEELRIQMFNANLSSPPPPPPPENIITEQDKHKQISYEQWLNRRLNALTQQLKFYEAEVNKLRKVRKSLNSKQRQLRKSGNQLTEADANELQRISSDQSKLQKHLEASRKLSRQHGLLIQEYRNKQQAKQSPGPGHSPLLIQQNSPLGPPSSSPIHSSQSPLMSPSASASPLTQHNSPLHSPSPMISHSPGAITMLQSPVNTLSPMQPSRIGTPHSQGDSSPGPAPSPVQVCLPPPAPRMTSPQHKRVVTSPVGYVTDLRPGTPQMRFVRTPMDQRRLPSPLMYQQKPGTPSPLSSPPPPQINIGHQFLQKQLEQHDSNALNSQRAIQLMQQRNFIRQQQQQQQQQNVGQPQPLTPQQHQLMVQQQQQLAKQQQQQIAQMQAQLQQQRLSQPPSPMPPKSPLMQQIMSPHSMPLSPMPPRSPMMSGNFTSQQQQQPPSSPVLRGGQFSGSSPMYQTPSSPLLNVAMRPPSTSGAGTMQIDSTAMGSNSMDGGGGNPHTNPIPGPYGRYGFVKMGLRGGSPMWNFGRGAKRIPTPPVSSKDDKSGECSTPPLKPRKESHLSKVSILKRKSPTKSHQQVAALSKMGSLVSTDYNEFDDSSCTPPVTPPPAKNFGKIIHEVESNSKEAMIAASPDEKQINCEDIMDYDDNNTVISGEVSLSSTAQQNDGDDMNVIETFSQSDLGEPMSSPLESNQIPEEYVLFPGNMVVHISNETHYSDKEEETEEEYLQVVIRSPTTSDDEYLMQNKPKKIIRRLPSSHVIVEDSPDPEENTALTTHDSCLPKKIFEDDSVSPDSSNCGDEKSKDSSDEKSKPDLEFLNKHSESSNQVQENNGRASGSPVLHTPELKMTAQIIQESQGMQITARTETGGFETGVGEDTKSVVISIPSPTPSQEQMLDNMALQALENRRGDGNGMAGEFESFEDVLDMIENITPTALDSGIQEPPRQKEPEKIESKVSPQLSSPLSQPTELTTNMANASQQLRTLLSSLHTTAVAGTNNVESVVKSVNKVTTTPSVLQHNPLVSSRVIQHCAVSASSTNLVSNVVSKQKAASPVSGAIPFPSRGIHLMPEHPKLPRVVPVVKEPEPARKTTCSLTEMLQSHPAAVPTTKSTVESITAASLLGTSMALTRSGFSTALVQAQPNVVSPITTNATIPTSVTNFKTITPSKTNLLHTQLTKVIRAKSLDEPVKEDQEESAIESKPDINKFHATHRAEDSQNALLKKLLQNTACASTQTPLPTSQAPPVTVCAAMQFPLTSSTPTLSSILPTVAKETKPLVVRTPIMTRETSFVSNPIVSGNLPPQQLHIDVKKCLPPSNTPSRDDLLSPQTPRSSCSQDSSLQTPPLIIKKENMPFPVMISAQDVKKEVVDDNSQHSEVSDQSRTDVSIKEEMDSLDVTEKMVIDQKEELKRQKRRMYQQKRRQNQIINKEAIGQPKKRPRKSSKLDEDYDTYIDGVLGQLRSVQTMVVSEPTLNLNYNILPIFGSDFQKLSSSEYDTRYGELKGEYGNATVPGYLDFYSSQPYGDDEQLPEKSPASTQRGFYDQEFPLIKFDSEDDKRFDLFSREDTPDSIVSSSSPECPDLEPPCKFLGLKLINEDDDDDDNDEDMEKMRLSPVVPIIAPVPIRLMPIGTYLKDYTEDKENLGRELCTKGKFASTPPTPLKDSGNVTVTLTLTSSAAEDIMGVLRDLANILHIPAPTSYQIVERTGTPPSHKLGLYRSKGKDGKEGASVDIQSILNGAAKFCKHCDVVILNNMIKKKVSELSFLAKDSELLSDGDELFFCSSACYMQFALMHRSPAISEDKAAAIIDHLSQKDKGELARGPYTAAQSKLFMGNIEMELQYFKKEMEPVNEFKQHGLFNKQFGKVEASAPKVWKGRRYKVWTPGCLHPPVKYKKLTDKEMMELLYRMGITVMPPKLPEDTRKCIFCQGVGDGIADGTARLLNFDVDKWMHLNCGLWSDGVYETVNGALINIETALQQSLTQTCVHCDKLGATIRCFKARCTNIYHLSCAVKDGAVFYKNKTIFCMAHIPKGDKDSELTTLSVSRRVYVNRDENRQVATVMHHSETNNLLRVGSLIFLSIGQLLPHQLQNFHTSNYIYPIGYKIIRFYWSMRFLNKRCKYICSIHDFSGRPEFRVLIQEVMQEDIEIKDLSPKAVWLKILDQIARMRRDNQCVQLFPKFVSGEDLFGLTEPAVVRVLESLPGVETLTDYKFKYGRNPLLELPLAINPSGSARTEPRSRNQLHWKRPHTQRTAGASARPLFGPQAPFSNNNNNTLAEGACPYTKQFVHSKSSQYKKMKQEWRNNVYLARSKIQGLGLYAARDLEKHTMVIEYIGEIIRTELAETREKKYEAKNRGIYMFRLDEERVVDATLSGGLARYINHSCNPNCVAENVEVERDCRIIIFAKRRIQRGEELSYDYKFDIEDDQHKISCMCGAPNCRKWMN